MDRGKASKENIMKKITAFLLAAVVAGAAPAFAQTHSDFSKAFGQQGMKTFAFENQRRISRDPLANNGIWANDLRDAIRRELTNHGYAEATGGRPDFYVASYVGLKDRYDINSIGYGMPAFHRRLMFGGWPRSYDAWAVPYTESTVIIDVIDARTHELVWRGYDTGTLNTGKPEKTLDSAVDHVLSRLSHDVTKQQRHG
jgi:hypothetical protein